MAVQATFLAALSSSSDAEGLGFSPSGWVGEEQVEVFPDFCALYDDLRKTHPHLERGRRIDGDGVGGNPTPAGYFAHQNSTWRLNSDSHTQPLKVAYDAMRAGRNPFVVSPTRGGRECLELAPELKKALPSHRGKLIYI